MVTMELVLKQVLLVEEMVLVEPKVDLLVLVHGVTAQLVAVAVVLQVYFMMVLLLLELAVEAAAVDQVVVSTVVVLLMVAILVETIKLLLKV